MSPASDNHSGVIVVGIDGSTASQAALAWAASLARHRHGRLRLVTAWQYPATAALPGGPDPAAPEVMDQRAEAVIDRALEAIHAAGMPHPGQLVERRVVARGPATAAIIAQIDTDTDLVVLGRRGLGAIEGVLLGSVSRRVSEMSPVPVVLVGDEAPSLDGPVVVGVDSSAGSAAARDWAAGTAGLLGVDLVIVHGIAGLPMEIPPSAIDHIEGRAAKLAQDHAVAARAVRPAPAEVLTEVDISDPRRLLQSVAHDRSASMIVIGSRGEGAAAGLLTGTVVNRLMQHGEHPVVIVTATRPGV